MSAQVAAKQKAAKAKATSGAKPCAKAAAKKDAAMAARATGVTGNPTLRDAPTGCSDAVCGAVLSVVKTKTKELQLTVDVGEEEPMVVSTLFADVTEGARVAVAVAGSFVGDVQVPAAKLCDVVMLGWDAGGSTKVAAVMPRTLELGQAVPETRPTGRGPAEVDASGNAVNANPEMENLYVTKPKLSKEDKELEKLEAKEAKRLAKLAKSGKEDEAFEPGTRAPNKLELARIRKTIRDKRAAGEDAFTGDETEAAGFLVE
jgi:hypothetical protein